MLWPIARQAGPSPRRASPTRCTSPSPGPAPARLFIPVSFRFDGKLPGNPNPHTASAELNYSFSFGSAYAYEFGDYGAGYFGINNNYPTFVYAGAPRIGGWQSASFTSYDPLNTRFSGVYAITGSVDIGHVAGVSYTSDSGVFLAGGGSVGGVPEPASWALMVAGFGIAGAAARRRRFSVMA